jgi:hypothetical protein
LATLRCLMTPGPDAHWLDLGPDWLEVVVAAGSALGVSVSLDELDDRWQAAESKDELKNLGQLMGLLAGFVRAARTTCSPGDRSRA